MKQTVFWLVAGLSLVAFSLAASMWTYQISLNRVEPLVAVVSSGQCPEAQACPDKREKWLLRNCHPPEKDNTPYDSWCNEAGKAEVCGDKTYCCPKYGGNWTVCAASPSPSVSPSPSPGVSPSPSASPRPDYCVSASVDGIVNGTVTKYPGETLILSSVSNPPVNGFFYATYNLDNNPAGNSPGVVCLGTGADPQCPNGGKPLIFADPWNQANGTGLRTEGSAEIPYSNLFITDKSTGEQVKNIQFNAYFSLDGGQWSWSQKACLGFTKMGMAASPSPSPSPSPSSSPSPSASPSPSPSPSPGLPPAQPDTGTPTALTLFLGLGIMGLLWLKKLISAEL